MWVKCQKCGIELLPSKQFYSWTNLINTSSGYCIETYEYFCLDCMEILEMPTAKLSYEALALDSEGNITEGAYRLKLEGNFKRDIEPMVIFIKQVVPSSDRTYDPKTYEWFYHEKYHSTMENALKQSKFQVNYSVTKEQFVELKRKQDEFARQAGQTFQTKQYNTDEDLETFQSLIIDAYTNTQLKLDLPLYDILKNWSREQALEAYRIAIKFYHPDRHPEREAQAAELNDVWTRLKGGYYVK